MTSNLLNHNFIHRPKYRRYVQPHKGHLISKLNSKTVPVLPSLDSSLIFPFHVSPSPVHIYRIYLLFLPWLSCHLFLGVIEQQPLYCSELVLCISLVTQKGFLHLKVPKVLIILSCSGIYRDTKTVCFKFGT